MAVLFIQAFHHSHWFVAASVHNDPLTRVVVGTYPKLGSFIIAEYVLYAVSVSILIFGIFSAVTVSCLGNDLAAVASSNTDRTAKTAGG